jgi:hypothetical protein
MAIITPLGSLHFIGSLGFNTRNGLTPAAPSSVKSLGPQIGQRIYEAPFRGIHYSADTVLRHHFGQCHHQQGQAPVPNGLSHNFTKPIAPKDVSFCV